MKRTIVVAQLLALLVIVASCAPKPEVEPDAPKYPPAESVPPDAMGTLDDRYRQTIDTLIPKMASDDLKVRADSQTQFESFCLMAGRPGAEEERVAMCRQIIRRLDERTPQLARVWMVRQLERIGRDEAVNELAQLLGDRDPFVRETARRALQKNPSDKVGFALARALEKADTPEWQIALLNVLGARRETENSATVIDWATRSQGDVAAAAIAALGDIGGSEATETLYTLWQSDDPVVHNHAANALLRIGYRLAEDGKRQQAARLFDDLYVSSTDGATRMAALHGLTLSRGPASVAILLEIMQDGEPEMRLRAARLALGIPGEAITLTLAMMMYDMSPSVQVVLLEGLGKRGDATARAAAVNGTYSSDREVRIAALGALQNLGNSSDVTLLAQIATEATGPERDAARDTLGRLRGADVDETIMNAMDKHEDAAVRCELIRALGARWYRPAIPALLAATKDSVEEVQVAAFDALGGLARADNLPELTARLLEELGEEARAAAENAVVEIALGIDDEQQRPEHVLAVLDDTGGAARASLIRVLGRIGGRRALQTIRAEYPGPDTQVVDAAVRALANWPDPEVIYDLLMIARTSTSQAHAVLALRGYVRLVRLPSEREPIETFRMLEEAMSLAERPEEKKLVLGALAEVRHIDVLMLAELQLGDEALCNEAAVAMLTIARALAAEHPAAALAAIEKACDAATDEKVQQQANETVEFIDRFAGYSAAWLISGPYFEEGTKPADLYDMVFKPEKADATGVEWATLAINNHDNPWIFTLDKSIGGFNRCVYVRTDVWSNKQQIVKLEIGSDDAVKVWLNGKLVHSHFIYRGVEPAQDIVEVTLNQGWNTLMLKVVQGGGEWGFCAGFSTPAGGKIEGLKFRAE